MSVDNKVHISDHFTFKKIFFITIIPILACVFGSIYGVVDGICVSNFAGDAAFIGLNLIYPATMIIGGLAFMFGSGGSALVSKTLGEGDKEKANRYFSMVIYFALIVGVILSIVGFFLVEPIVHAFARINDTTSDAVVKNAIIYGKIIMLGQFTFIMQFTFQMFFVTAEKIRLSFIFTFSAGMSNIVLDLLFVGLFKWGVVGAAAATIIGQTVASVGPFIYFLKKRDGLIYLTKTRFEIRPLVKACTNGVSELITNVSGSLVSLMINAQLLKYIGENGVLAYGIIMYIQYIFIAIYFGYCQGMAPPLSFHYGAKNDEEKHNILVKSLIIILFAGITMLALGLLLTRPLTYIFVSDDEEVINISIKAIRIYSLCYLSMGFSIYLSSFFTALNNGIVSGIISLLRTLIFQIIFILLIPLAMGGDGVWYGIVLAEASATIVAFLLLALFKKKYNY